MGGEPLIATACMVQAANAYHVPVAAIETVIASPHPPGAIGPMGIPTAWLQTLAHYGFNPDRVIGNDCDNIRAGAWILAANPQATVVPVERAGSPTAPATPLIDLPSCAIEAASTYRVPLDTVFRVIQAHQPGSGAGPMGVPLAWLPTLAHYGFNPYLVQHDVCMGLVAGEWILGLERMQGDDAGSSQYPVDVNSDVIPPAWVLPMAAAAATTYRVPEAFLLAIAAQESGFHTGLTSSAGAQGLMQLMPETAVRNGVSNPFDPNQSMDGAASYLSTLFAEFDGNLPLIAAAYNAGDQAVINYGHSIPPFTETENYVPDVLARYAYYTRMLPSDERKSFPATAISAEGPFPHQAGQQPTRFALSSENVRAAHIGPITFGP